MEGVATNAEESEEAKDNEVEVELPYDIVNLEIIINKRDCLVP